MQRETQSAFLLQKMFAVAQVVQVEVLHLRPPFPMGIALSRSQPVNMWFSQLLACRVLLTQEIACGTGEPAGHEQ